MPLKRDRALQAHCPKCGSSAGDPCIGAGGLRRSVHRARLTAPVVEALPVYAVLVRQEGGFYRSDEWRRLRYKALRRQAGHCECCGARGTRYRPLHVDHIKPRSKYPELALELSNLQVLCADCNLGKGSADETDWRAVQ